MGVAFQDLLEDHAPPGPARGYYRHHLQFHVRMDEFFMALIFTTSDSMTPVGVGLLQIVNAMKYSGQYGAMFAAVIIVFLPTFLLYLFLSEKIIAGVTGGGVKG